MGVWPPATGWLEGPGGRVHAEPDSAALCGWAFRGEITHFCDRACVGACGSLPCKMANEQEIEKTPALGADVPQFATAEYAHIPGTERCRICSSFISGEYYRVNNQMACAKCAGEAREGQPSDSHASFARALLLGAGAALIGLILYAAFTITTSFYFGYIALGVGWLVAKAMLKGSNGIGGRRYQIAAVLLTYTAISMAAVPIGIAGAIKHQKEKTTVVTPAGSADSSTNTGSVQDTTRQNAAGPGGGLGGLLLQLLFLGLASPFMELQDPVHGLIGLVILFVGLRIAFQLTAARALDVDGPHNVMAG